MGALADPVVVEVPPIISPVVVDRAAWLPHIHAARGLAILAIILVHTASTFSFAPHSFASTVGPGLRDISGFFMMISGYLFQHFATRFSYGSYLQRKFQIVILPYAIISSLAIAIYLLGFKSHPWLPPAFFHQSPSVVVGSFLLTGAQLGPFWFIPTIALYYIAAPIFLWIDQKPSRYYLIVPALVLSIMVPRAQHDASVLQAAAHFLVVYLVGMAASRFANRWTGEARRYAVALLIIGVVISAAGLAIGSESAQLVFKLPLFFAVLGLLLRFPIARTNFLNRLAAVSFGLFFAHGYVIAAVRMLDARVGQMVPSNGLGLICMFLLVTAMTWAIVEGLKAMLGSYSRYIIGA